MCGPYATVIDIDPAKLPDPKLVAEWDGTLFANTLRNIPGHPDYNPSFRQLIHVAYKIAALYGDRFTDELKKNKVLVGASLS